MQPDSVGSQNWISPRSGSRPQQPRSLDFVPVLPEAVVIGVVAGESSAKVDSLVLPALPPALDVILLDSVPCYGEDRLL